MNMTFVQRFDAARESLREGLKATPPGGYADLVKRTIAAITDAADQYTTQGAPDPERIHQIDDGHYQGTLVFVIAAMGYQPSDYWYVKVSYGSCSGCDTFESICDYSDTVSDAQANEYLTLMLHILQGLKRMGEEVV